MGDNGTEEASMDHSLENVLKLISYGHFASGQNAFNFLIDNMGIILSQFYM